MASCAHTIWISKFTSGQRGGANIISTVGCRRANFGGRTLDDDSSRAPPVESASGWISRPYVNAHMI